MLIEGQTRRDHETRNERAAVSSGVLLSVLFSEHLFLGPSGHTRLRTIHLDGCFVILQFQHTTSSYSTANPGYIHSSDHHGFQAMASNHMGESGQIFLDAEMKTLMKIFKLGVTGSRHGWTKWQQKRFMTLLSELPWQNVEVHHGCCVGADAFVHEIALDKGYRIVGHPPLNPGLMIPPSKMQELDETHPPKDYNDRNVDIVYSVDLLFGGPGGPRYEKKRKQKSGSWNTIEIAIKAGKPCEVAMPMPWEKADTTGFFFSN